MPRNLLFYISGSQRAFAEKSIVFAMIRILQYAEYIMQYVKTLPQPIKNLDAAKRDFFVAFLVGA